MSKQKKLSLVDGLFIWVSWLGALFAAVFSMSALATLVAVGAGFYTAKLIIVDNEEDLSMIDLICVVLVWSMVVATSYFTQSGLVAIVCIVSAYYISTMVVLKTEP